jgi:uncharacterized protein with HEPN domain
MRNTNLYLKDILAAIDSIENFVAGMDWTAFQGDDKTTSAVIQKFEVIGEATKQIPEEIRQKYPHVPWKGMAGMRDVLIHSYFKVDHKLVWQTVKESLPEIRPEIQKVLDEI